MTSASLSHPGLVRKNNEYFIHSDDSLGIYLLADGMGGHNAGEVASALAVETVYNALKPSILLTADNSLFDLITNAMQVAHWEINQKARTSLAYMGMGTTLVVAVVRDLATRDSSLDTLAGNLIDAANAHGGQDNISVILVGQL